MRRFARILALLAVATVPPASAIVAAQQPATRTEAPPSTDTAKVAVPADAAPTIKIEKVAPRAEAPADGQPIPSVAVGKTTVTIKVQKQAEVQKKADKVEAQVIRRLGVNQNVAAQAQRYVLQLRPMVRSEIHLVLATCSPDPEQRAAILAEEERVLDDVANQFAQAQMGGIRRPGGVMPDPRTMIPELLAKVANDRLSPEQAKRYRAESEAKAEFSRKVALANIVANLDEDLLLSPDQRARLARAIDSNWKPAWLGSIQAHLSGGQMVPLIPDAVVVPILDPVQKRAWDKKQKSMTTYWGNFLVLGNFALEEPPAAPAAAKPPLPAGGNPP